MADNETKEADLLDLLGIRDDMVLAVADYADGNEDFRDLDFASMAKSPGAWLGKASELRSAAEELWKVHDAVDADANASAELHLRNSGRFDIVCLLYGFALENAAKGAVVALDPDAAVTETAKRDALKLAFKNHDLPSLFEHAGEELNDGDKRTLLYLKRCITFFGRYPTPVRSTDMNASRLTDPSGARAALADLFERMAARIRRALGSRKP